MSEPPNHPATLSVLPSPRLVVVEVAVVLGVFFLQGAWPVPDSNEAHYLSKAIHYWNPGWIAADPFLDSADTHKVFYFTVGWLSLLLPPTVMAWVGRILCWGSLAWAWRRLSFAILPYRGAAVLTAAGFVCLQSRFQMAGEWVVGGVEAKGFAYALVFLGLESLVRGRWNRTWLLLGAAGAFHVLVGGWSVVAAGVAWVLSGSERPPIKSMWQGLAGGLLLSLPGLIPSLSMTWGVDANIVQEANRIYVFQRLGHHLLPSHFATTAVIRFLVLTAIWIAISWIRPLSEGQRRLRAFVAGTLVLTLVGLAIAWSTEGNPALAAGLLRFYWFRMSDFAVAAGVALSGPVLLVWLLRAAQRATPATPPTPAATPTPTSRSQTGRSLSCRFAEGLIGKCLTWWIVAVLGMMFGLAAAAGVVRFTWAGFSGVVYPKEVTVGTAMVVLWAILWLGRRWGASRCETNRPWLAAAIANLVPLVILAPVFHLAQYAVLRCQPVPPRADPANPHDYFAWRTACRWIVDHPQVVPPDARFFTPLTSLTFKWYTARSEVATWKDVPQDPRSIVAWWKRLDDVYATGLDEPGRRWHERLSDALQHRGPDELQRLRRQYEADYVLAVRRPPLDLPPLNLEVVYRNNVYVIYRLDGRPRKCHP